MGRILCAWEYGGDLGHIRRLAALARALARAGHEPVLALGNLAHAAAVIGLPSSNFRVEWHQAPLIAAPRVTRAPLSATDVLAQIGLGEMQGVRAALRAWQGLFSLVKPAALVADYAPVAMLAARIAGVPRVNIGSGFSSPPRADPMPALRSWLATDATRLRQIDAQLLDSVNGALGSVGAAPLASAGELFDADLDLVCTIEPLDPFGPREGIDYLGPLDDSASGLEVDWSHSAHPRVAAYLKPRHPHFKAVVAALASLPGETIVAAPELSGAEAVALSGDRIRVIASAVNLAKLLPGADLCIGHGGAGFCSRALAAGLPLGLLVMQLEQFLIGRRIEALGAAAMVHPEMPSPDFADWLAQLTTDPAKRSAAQRMGTAFAGLRPESSAERAAARVGALAAA